MVDNRVVQEMVAEPVKGFPYVENCKMVSCYWLMVMAGMVNDHYILLLVSNDEWIT